MAVKIGKKSSPGAAKPAAKPAPKATQASKQEDPPWEDDSAKASTKSAVTGKPSGGFMKGKAAQKALAEEEQKTEEKKAAAQGGGKLFDFYLKEKEEGTITFLDGELDEDGLLDVPAMYRHEFFENGKFASYVCLETNPEWGPCPICESTDNTSTFITAFTVIDHRKYKSPKTGKVYENTRKVLIAKPQTTKMLNKYAQHHGGLAGCTFEVSRTSDKSPRAGDVYMFLEKRTTADIQAEYGEEMVAADYEQQIEVYSRKELMEMGFGSTGGIGNEPDTETESDFANQL